ncbi:hypothetical protein BH10BAC2_BH10BAC2_25360 [soil metagenome]
MNQHLETILNFIQHAEHLSDEEKAALLKAAKAAGKELEITSFKLDRTEKVKRTTAILLEETIEELEQKRKAVEAQNRELEIEAALERVRTVAMSMNKTDDVLSICKVMFTELKSLGFDELRTTLINFFDDEHNALLDYDYADFSGGHVAKIPYNSHPTFENFQKRIRSSTDAFAELVVGEDELESWKERRRQSGEYEDPRLENIAALYYYFYSIGVGAVGISTFSSLNEEKLKLIKRFRNVFDLAYRRYIDIEKAEAQAREAQIELALERVRARTMAMQKSDELDEITMLILRQLEYLEIFLAGIGIHICASDIPESEAWMWDMLAGKMPKVTYNHTHDRLSMRIYEGWKKGETLYVEEVKGEKLKDHLEYVSTLLPDPTIYEDSFPALVFHIVYFTYGFFVLVTSDHCPNEHTVFIRFAKVFEQTYTRFLDLQKAEAQARESQIQLALERVRARTMAMQHSDELPQAAILLFQQMQGLNMPAWSAGYCIWDKDKQGITLWMGSEGVLQQPVHVPLTEDRSFIHMREAYERGESFYAEAVGGEELVQHYKYMRTLPVVGEVLDGIINEGHPLPVFQIFHLVYFSQGFLLFITYEPVPDAHDIFKRFGNVFDQTYTRFLDLQKAEAQVREAGIEAALERVRSRSIGMQKSEELKEVIKIVYQQLTHLKINLDHSGFVVDYTPKGDWHFWIADEQDIPSKITHPYFESVWANQFNIAKEKDADFFATHLNFEEKNKFYNELLSYVPGLPQASKDFYLSRPGLAASTVLFDNVSLYIENFSGTPYSDEENKILMRFGKVFEQTYTRFLDLQKAEAQTREAKIETALEKVRSRSLAVHKSDEFKDVIKVVFERLQELEIPLTSVSISIFIEGSKDTEAYVCGLGEGGLAMSHLRLVYFDHPIHNDRYDAYEKGLDFFTKIYSAEEKNSFYEYEFEVSDLKNIPADIKKMVMESERYTISMALNKHSMIVVNDFEGKSLSAHEIDVVKRFAKVFDQTYTRFLDLLKAEAQTREAQIETALEKVRSRSLAMHKTDELQEVVTVVLERMTDLNIELDTINIGIFKEDIKEATLWTAAPGQKYAVPFHIPFIDQPFQTDIFTAKKNGLDLITKTYSYKEKNSYFKYAFEHTDFKNVPEAKKKLIMEGPACTRSIAFTKNAGIIIIRYAEKPFTEIENEILKRFAKVFEQAYTRFLDLQKAEAQAREAQIEAALERVRSKTMAMHNSNDVGESVATMFAEFVHLGIQTNRCGILIFGEETTAEVWTAKSNPEGKATLIIGKLNLAIYNMLSSAYDAWKAKETFFKYDLLDEDLIRHYEAINNSENYPVKFDLNKLPSKEFHNDFFFNEGALFAFTSEAIPEEHSKIFKRFAGVFGQTYTRFLDLQKAEAQARESQIEVALERVRSRSLAMHKSDELQEVIETVFDQILKLGILADVSNFLIFNQENRDSNCWIASPTQKINRSWHMPYMDIYPLNELLIEKENGNDSFMASCSFEQKNKFFHWAFEHSDFKYFPDDRKEFVLKSKCWTICYAWVKYTGIQISSYSLESFTENDKEILKRFARVFEQSYTRFLDLQKAEAQARESQIQLALERVRARTMAMQKSEELQETAALLFQQVNSLGVVPWACGFNIYDNDRKAATSWMASEFGKGISSSFKVPVNEHIFKDIFQAAQSGEPLYIHEINSDKIEAHYKYMFAIPVAGDRLKGFVASGGVLPTTQILHAAFFSHGYLLFITQEPVPETLGVFKRFAKVFEQTYTRFLDLQKAEAQAREAKIEAALERVRSKTMAMQNSEDVTSATETMFDELKKLGIDNLRCGIANIHHNRTFDVFGVTNLAGGNKMSGFGLFGIDEHPIWQRWFESWKNKETVFIAPIAGQEKEEYFNNINNHNNYLPKQLTDFPDNFFQSYYFEQGSVWAYSLLQHSEPEKDIMKRFASGFSLTFRRYQDLKKAEAQTREAIKASSLDRVRGEIASMRNAEDLHRITPLVWKELTALSVPFFRCGVMIVEEKEEMVQFYLSTPEGKPLAALHLPFNSIDITRNGVKEWRLQKVYTDHWDKEQFIAFTKSMIELGQIQTANTYQGGEEPPESLTLQFVPFTQGMMYVGSAEPLTATQIDLVQALADSISVAYARYEDFTKLEAAKAQIENTLTELQATQKQLIQSEKMASLGELTAGIAHEIQNPLNFVNNFSEVSNELIDEMKDELAKGNYEDAKEIADDVKQNLEKINHHGQRASAIVKGMLQHSRSSSSVKEPTDINALCDEYLRLTYHGLRAKDKSFNATMQTDFDESIGKINIIPQDIGRVILNLITNAFYTVTEMKKSSHSVKGGQEYEPTVSVTTKRINSPLGDGGIEISVADNGNGIPQKIVDKIFQPFFTTKPTGQGTGLGLSLSYDIVKVHGGDLKVETMEGEGSTFIIQLPIV